MDSKKEITNRHQTDGLTRQAPLNRRRFLESAGVITVSLGFGATPLRAEDLPRLDEKDPTAVALSYVHDATKVDPSKRAADRLCNNCALFAGKPGNEWQKCTIFPGKLVAGGGWCSAWAPKAAG